MRYGLLLILSAPSGTGKTTLARRLVERLPEMVMSRSYTSRPPRPRETDGVDYNFVDRSRFAEMIESGAFLEWATIFDHLYGTSAADTEAHRVAGRDVVLVIDTQGAQQLRAKRVAAVSVFVMPPSFAVLEARLRGRGGPEADESEVGQRLATARREIAERDRYDYVVINEDVTACVDRLRCIVVAERARVAAMAESTNAIAATFTAG